jgi:hypothetical protein
MSSHIDPKILAKLRAFAARRRKLILLRGICTALAMLLATMMLVALIDWLFVLPDYARWALSGAAYLAVIIAEWRTCVRLLAHSPDPRQLARLVEHAEPALREDLLSAVELGSEKQGEGFDSPQFRELVQSGVAARVENLDMSRLLPVNLVKRYLGVAAVILIALIVAFSVTGLQFGTLLMRALLPMGNFARVSKFQVKIVEPSPAEGVIPQGDTVPLVIEVTGGSTRKATLETFSETGGREVFAMTPTEEGRFSATIQVGREAVQYRVRAGDAMTRKYRFDAAARPYVVTFDKIYRLPEYTRSEPKQVSEENGDLAALEGTTVELRLRTNQAVKSGELRLDQGKQQTVVPLQREGEHLIGQVPITASGTYRVFLVGAETGFENKFSPEYEIRAEPDLIPQVELELPKTDLILPANEIVDLRGTASDDQALAKVSQHVRVNDGQWQETPLVTNPGQKTIVERRWSLHEQGVKAGDLLTVKLVATDLKGSKGESRPLQVTITAAGFETKRLQALEARRLHWETLKSLRVAADAFEKRAAEAREQFNAAGDNEPQRRQMIVSATAAMDEFESKWMEASAQLVAALQNAAPAHESAELVLLGRFLARIKMSTAQFARDPLDLATAHLTAPFAGELFSEVRDYAGRTAHRVRLAEDAARGLLGVDELDVLIENARVVSGEQERLGALAQNSGEDAAKWAQLTPRMRVVLAEARTIELLMESAASHFQGGGADRLRRMQKELEKHRTAFVQALESGALGKPLITATTNLTKATADTTRKLLEGETRRDESAGQNHDRSAARDGTQLDEL